VVRYFFESQIYRFIWYYYLISPTSVSSDLCISQVALQVTVASDCPLIIGLVQDLADYDALEAFFADYEAMRELLDDTLKACLLKCMVTEKILYLPSG
jgi:hypothetical protein